MKTIVSTVKAPLIVAASMLAVEIAALVFQLADSLVLALLYGSLFFAAIALLLIYAFFDIREYLRSRSLTAFFPSVMNLLIVFLFVALSSLLACRFPNEEANAKPREHGVTLKFD